jgi:hypothetical protein
MITVTQHDASEWARMAQAAYREGRNRTGHRYSAAAATLAGKRIEASVFDALQRPYRQWLLSGFDHHAV